MIAAVAGLLIWPAGTASAAAGSQTVWKVQATPNPAGVLGSQLTGVSCPSAKACFAVGASSTGDQGNQPLAEHWNGTVWAIQHAVKPKTSEDTDHEAISCPTVSNCTAVGFYTNTSGSNLALAEHWNGSAWSVQRIPAGATEGSALIGVSCPSAADCTAALGNRLLHQQQCASEAARGALERHLLGGRGCPRSLRSEWQLAAGRGLVLIAQQVHRRRLVAEQVRDQLHACRTQVDRDRRRHQTLGCR
jgi:hypothetical protein